MPAVNDLKRLQELPDIEENSIVIELRKQLKIIDLPEDDDKKAK